MNILYMHFSNTVRKALSLGLLFTVGVTVGFFGASKSDLLKAVFHGRSNTLAVAENVEREQCISGAPDQNAPLFISCAGFLE